MPALEIEGVWKEWDDEETREAFQNGGTILEPPYCADISTCVKNRYMLSPLLAKMALHESRCLPPVDQLKEEIDCLLKRYKQGMESEFLEVSKKSWHLKKMCGFIKCKARRREVSTVTGLIFLQEKSTIKA